MNVRQITQAVTRRASRTVTILGLGVLIGAGSYWGFVAVRDSYGSPPPPVTEVAMQRRPVQVNEGAYDAMSVISTGIADLAEAATPAVVQIEVQQSVTPGPAFQVPEQFRRFFQPPGGEEQNPVPQYAGGSGFIISDDGYIVTNDHVAGDADEITVTLSDQRIFEATLVGSDPTTDVAVIKIDAHGLPALSWGSSAELRVGEWVMAIGNPGLPGADQLDYTVTTGIVSAKGRPLRLLGRSLAEDPEYGGALAGYAIENFIQTDAVINPGNSGGPMLNVRGQVVGVNSAIASTDGRFQGYGFAIPSDLVQRVASDLIEHGRVLRPWLGVSVASVSPEDAEAYGLPEVQGVLVQSVAEGGPAESAGVRTEDVIVSVGGTVVRSGGHLQELIAEREQHERVTLRVYRDGRARDMTVELGEAPVSRVPVDEARPAARKGSARLGLELGELTPSRASQLGFETPGGALILNAEPMGRAARKGVGPGLVIQSVNGRTVSDAESAARELDRVDSGEIATLRVVAPNGQTRIVNIRAR